MRSLTSRIVLERFRRSSRSGTRWDRQFTICASPLYATGRHDVERTAGMIESRSFERPAIAFALVTTTIVVSGRQRNATQPATDTTRRPSLVVLVVVDQ